MATIKTAADLANIAGAEMGAVEGKKSKSSKQSLLKTQYALVQQLTISKYS